MESRLHIYNKLLAERDALAPEFISMAGRIIIDRVSKMEEFRTARRVGLYLPYKNEVPTVALFEHADINRKELYLPAKDKEQKVSYYRILDLADVLPQAGGIVEVSKQMSRLRTVNNLNAMIVPGVVFDKHGRRMGFGMGFFDSCLAGFNGVRIALAYDFQVVDKIPMLTDSRRLDFIVTEKRIVRCS